MTRLKGHNIKAPIFGISRLRMGTDGCGITTLVTFMGCPLKCKYCLNRKCHEPIYEKDGKTLRNGIMMLTPKELYDLVRIDNLYFQSTGGGICFGGGEPTLYEDFIIEFKKLCGDRWKITLETCLRCLDDTIKHLSSVADLWIVDIKSMNPNIYKEYTGRDSEILQQLKTISTLVHRDKVIVKVPYIPGYNDGSDLDANVEEIKNRYGFTKVYKVEYKEL